MDFVICFVFNVVVLCGSSLSRVKYPQNETRTTELDHRPSAAHGSSAKCLHVSTLVTPLSRFVSTRHGGASVWLLGWNSAEASTLESPSQVFAGREAACTAEDSSHPLHPRSLQSLPSGGPSRGQTDRQTDSLLELCHYHRVCIYAQG